MSILNQNQPESDWAVDWLKEEILSSEEPLSYLTDIVNNGCISGIIPSVIYYKQTNDFYDKYQDEIEEHFYRKAIYREEDFLTYVGSLPGSENVGGLGQFKNHLVWSYIDELAYDLFVGPFKKKLRKLQKQ